jgi:hypothetical protein
VKTNLNQNERRLNGEARNGEAQNERRLNGEARNGEG